MVENPVPAGPPVAGARGATARRRLRIAAALASVTALTGAFLVNPSRAQANTIDVTTTVDGVPGSLRAALSLANATPGPDVIQVPAGTYTLTIPGADEDGNLTGDLDVTGDVTIVGAGASATIIDAAGIDRVLDVLAGSTTLQSVTIAHGNSGAGTTTGGGIRQQGAGLTVLDSVIRDNHGWGGAGIVSSSGVLDIRRSEIIDNVAVSEPGNGSAGGGIEKVNNSGSLSIVDSLLAGNQSVNGNAGALYTNTPSISIVSSTFTGNTQYSRTIVFEQYGDVAATASLKFVTIAGNASVGGAGGILSNVGASSSLNLTLEGVLLQQNTTGGASQNCAVQASGTFASSGSNLSDDATCTAFTQPGDRQSDGATSLGALASNGGPTRTRALLAGSSAIDAATCDPAVATDQRGAPRPAGAACDIGAFERDAVVPPSTTTTTTPASSTTTTVPGSTTTTPSGTSSTTSSTSSTSTSTSSTSTTSTSTSSTSTTSSTVPTSSTSTTTPTSTTTSTVPTSSTSTTSSTLPTSSTTSTTTSSTSTTAPRSTTTTTALATTTSTTQPSSTTTSSTSSTSSTSTTVDPVSATTSTRATPVAVIATGAGRFTATTLPVTGAAETLRLVLLAIGLLTGGFALVLGSRRAAGRRLAEHFEAQRPQD